MISPEDLIGAVLGGRYQILDFVARGGGGSIYRAKQMGLDMEVFQRSLDAGAYRGLVEVDRSDGEALGVKGTPSFFVNGRKLERLGYESLKELIEEEIAGRSSS